MTTNMKTQALQAVEALQGTGKPELQACIADLFKSQTPIAINVLLTSRAA